MLFAMFLFSASGQSLVSSEKILAGARHDLVMLFHGQHMSYLQQTMRTLPFVDQISLRTETDRFELNRQEYLARVIVNGLDEIHKMRLMHETEFASEEVMQRVYWHETLLERYEAVASYRHLLSKLENLRALRVVFEDKLIVLKKLAALNAGAELDELIKTEFALDELVLKISESEGHLEQWEEVIQVMTPEADANWVFDTSGFITPAQIEIVLAEIPESAIQNPQIAEIQARIDRIAAEFNFEKAQSNQILDFFQVRYASIPFAPLSRELSVGIALNLPFKGSSRVKMSELTIDKSVAHQNMELQLAELKSQLSISRFHVVALGKRFRLAQQQWQDSQGRFTLEGFTHTVSESPMTLLNTRELQLKRQMTILDIEREIIEQYIKILNLTGRLSAEPPVNYLSSNLGTY